MQRTPSVYTSSRCAIKPNTPEQYAYYMKIYEDYAIGYKRQQDVADEHNISRSQVMNIVKWARFELARTQKKVNIKTRRREAIERMKNRIRELKDDMQGMPLKLRHLYYREIRLHEKMIAEFEGLIKQGPLIDNSSHKKILVVTSDDLKHRQGETTD